MKIGIPKEIYAAETRVAATPDIVSKIIKTGNTVLVEKDAGIHSFFSNEDYKKVGAEIISTHHDLLHESDVVFKVHAPIDVNGVNEVEAMKDNSVLMGPLNANQQPALLKLLVIKKITAFSLELLPRIARAQSMDILSSMSNIAGYKSVILAADHLHKIFPMLTTAAGTILPAKVLVIGVGVAGLQAIATARRLGGVVIAFDTRPATEEQVNSLGANFVSLETSHDAQDAAGYAIEQSADFYKKEQNIISRYLKEADVIITTALIPGKPAPILMTEEMVKMMKPGSVIVDLSAAQGGNCVLTEANKIVNKYHVSIIGLLNLPATLSVNTSQLYAKNIFTFFNYLAPSLQDKQFDLSDEIIKQTLITNKGEILNSTLKSILTQ